MRLAHGLDEVVEIALGEQVGCHRDHPGTLAGQGFGVLDEALAIGQLGDRVPEGLGTQQLDVLGRQRRQLLQCQQAVLRQGGSGCRIEQAQAAQHQAFGRA